MTESRFFLYALGFELGLGVIAAFLGALLDVPVGDDLRIDARALACGLLATLPLLAWFGLSWRSDRPALREIRATLERLLPALLASSSTLRIAVLAAAAGIGEELLFRGFFQGFLEQMTGPATGLITASVLFGLAHAITPAYALVATLMALYLGAAWRIAGNLLVPITIHAAYDAAVIWYVLRTAPVEESEISA